jgi:hypothetical protein
MRVFRMLISACSGIYPFMISSTNPWIGSNSRPMTPIEVLNSRSSFQTRSAIAIIPASIVRLLLAPNAAPRGVRQGQPRNRGQFLSGRGAIKLYFYSRIRRIKFLFRSVISGINLIVIQSRYPQQPGLFMISF